MPTRFDDRHHNPHPVTSASREPIHNTHIDPTRPHHSAKTHTQPRRTREPDPYTPATPPPTPTKPHQPSHTPNTATPHPPHKAHTHAQTTPPARTSNPRQDAGHGRPHSLRQCDGTLRQPASHSGPATARNESADLAAKLYPMQATVPADAGRPLTGRGYSRKVRAGNRTADA